MSPASSLSSSEPDSTDSSPSGDFKSRPAARSTNSDTQLCSSPALNARLSRLNLRPASFDGILSISPDLPEISYRSVGDTTNTPQNPLSSTRGEEHDSEDFDSDPLTWLDRRDWSKSLSEEARCMGPLHPGACWEGKQQSGRTSYDVAVRIIDVDLSRGWAGGFMAIRNLTADMPSLCTYFDGEIIGLHHKFPTRKWGASEVDDLKHWSRFDAFRPLRHHFNSSDSPNKDEQPLFLRWKERFVVPDHKLDALPGASFDGFYYICISYGDPERSPPTRRRSQSLSPQLGKSGSRQSLARALSTHSPTETSSLAVPSSPPLRPPSPASPTLSSARLQATYAAVVRGDDVCAEGDAASFLPSQLLRVEEDDKRETRDCRPNDVMAASDAASDEGDVVCHHVIAPAGIGLGLNLSCDDNMNSCPLSPIGSTPWSSTTMSGYYFHAGGQCTSYQELTLAYSPNAVKDWIQGKVSCSTLMEAMDRQGKAKLARGPGGIGSSAFQFC